MGPHAAAGVDRATGPSVAREFKDPCGVEKQLLASSLRLFLAPEMRDYQGNACSETLFGLIEAKLLLV
jgi:hypothetical protein